MSTPIIFLLCFILACCTTQVFSLQGTIPDVSKPFSCEDADGSDCSTWIRNIREEGKESPTSDLELCEIDYHRRFMFTKCKKSCGYCKDLKEAYDSRKAEVLADSIKKEALIAFNTAIDGTSVPEAASSKQSQPASPKQSHDVQDDDDNDDPWLVLNPDNVEDVISSFPLLLLYVWAPWCGHCKAMSPEFEKAARELSTNPDLPIPVQFAKFEDTGSNRQYRIMEKLNMKSFPALLVFREGLCDGEVLEDEQETICKQWTAGMDDEPRTYHSLHRQARNSLTIAFLMRQFSYGKIQQDVIGDLQNVEKANKAGFYKKGGRHETEYVTELTDETFADEVLRTDKVVVVEFYSDHCPICVGLGPEIAEVAEETVKVDPRLKWAALNTRVWEGIMNRFGVTGYPWFSSFYAGKVRFHMRGMGGKQSFVNFAKNEAQLWHDSGKAANTSAQLPEHIKDDEVKKHNKRLDSFHESFKKVKETSPEKARALL